MSQISSKKAQYVQFASPFGIARYPAITQPDTNGKYSKGNFKTAIIFDDAAVVAKIRKEFQAAAKKLLPDVPVEKVKLPLREFEDKNKETCVLTSAGWGISAHSKKRPAVFTAKLQKLKEGANIGGGSLIRMAGALKAYEREKEVVVVDENGVERETKKIEYGLTLYLNEVQVKDLVETTSWGNGEAFDAVDGFEYTDTHAAETSSFGDATDL